METIAVILGAWGAILSTALAIREYRKDHRALAIILDYVHFVETAQITITNVVHRPATILNVTAALRFDGELEGRRFKQWEEIPPKHLFADPERWPIGKTLADGDFVSAQLTQLVGEKLLEGKDRVRIYVYDAEGRVYTKFRTRSYNPRQGTYSKK